MTLIGLNSNVFTPVATGDAPAVTPTSADVGGTSGNPNLVVDSKTYTPTAPNTADVTGSNDPTGSKDSTGDDRFDEFGNYISYYDAKPEIKAKYGSQWINAQGYLETRFGRSHRLIYIEYWGSLDDDLIVHHIDGNKLNNHPSNLKAISNSEHIKLHNKLRNNIDCKWF